MISRFVFITLLLLTSLHGEIVPQRSATGDSVPFREVCRNAAENEDTFQNFRSIVVYFNAVECGLSGEFAHYILTHATSRTLSLIPQFRKLDVYGNINSFDHLTPNEFIGLLTEKGMTPKIHPEPVQSHPDNILITWDKTKR